MRRKVGRVIPSTPPPPKLVRGMNVRRSEGRKNGRTCHSPFCPKMGSGRKGIRVVKEEEVEAMEEEMEEKKLIGGH